MSATIGDGITALALAGGIVGYFYVKHKSSRQRLEIIHQERLVAMEKGIPLPEFPLEPIAAPRQADPSVIGILGMVLFTLSLGTMIVLYIILPAASHATWVVPLPFAFLGAGFIAFNLLKSDGRR